MLVVYFFSELCWGKATVAYTAPQQWKKEESKQLRGERGQIKLIDLRFERWQVVRLRLYNKMYVYVAKHFLKRTIKSTKDACLGSLL